MGSTGANEATGAGTDAGAGVGPAAGSFLLHGAVGGRPRILWHPGRDLPPQHLGRLGSGGAIQVSLVSSALPLPPISRPMRMCWPPTRPARPRQSRAQSQASGGRDGHSHSRQAEEAAAADRAQEPGSQPRPDNRAQYGEQAGSSMARATSRNRAQSAQPRSATATLAAASAGTSTASIARWPRTGTSRRWIRARREAHASTLFHHSPRTESLPMCRLTAPAAAPRWIAPASAACSGLTPLAAFQRDITKAR